jgi:hypothetical protein
MIGIGLVFVVLNLFLANGPSGTRTFDRPTSLPARPGIEYRVRLLVPCEVVIDFDGAFWTPRSIRALRAPVEPATATLESTLEGGQAVLLRLASGQRFLLSRRRGPLRVAPCPSPHTS